MKSIFRKFVLFIILLGFSWTTAHAYEAAKQSEAKISPVIIGVPVPLSGRFKAFGSMMRNSFEMAVEYVNEKGGIHGRPIKAVYADDQGKVSMADEVIRKLVLDAKAVMLVGGYASNPTYHMAKKADQMNVPFLICTASADRITQMGWKNIYRLNPPMSEYSKGLEDFWIKLYRPKTMAIIYENTMFGTDGAKRMMAFCEENGIDVQAMIDYDKAMAGNVYLRSITAPLTLNTPDVIYMVSYLEDAVELVKTIKAIGIRSLLCGGAGGFTMEAFVKRAGNAANQLVTATLWSDQLPYPGAKAYFDAYLRRYGASPDYHGAEAYSAILVAADALERTKSLKPEPIRKALDNTFMVTPFGPVKFYSYYDFQRQNSTRTLVLQILKKRFEIVWPLEFATATFVSPAK